MSTWSDLKTLYHLTMSPIRGGTHAERLESFYQGQSEGYDSFRARLLRGREELFDRLPIPEGGVWVDLGAGTGANAQMLGDRLRSLKSVYLVDLSPSLLAIAHKRIADQQWTNVFTREADATTFQPDEGPVDLVTFSYSLTMIPDWFAAVDQAWAILKPGGVIGVVDFFVSRKYPASGHGRHPWRTRAFWPIWFGMDNVFPSPDHVPYLHRRFEPIEYDERRAKVPYLPLARTPYYQFIGRKRITDVSPRPIQGIDHPGGP